MSKDHDGRAEVARAWWRRLQPDLGRRRPGDPATLARLRRAADTAQALPRRRPCGSGPCLVSAATGWRVGTVARVLAHVRTPGEPGRRGALARALGPTEFGRFETARLKRLLATHEEEELARTMVRLVQLAGKDIAIDPGELADSILVWDDERTRIAWAFAYRDPTAIVRSAGDNPAATEAA